VNQGMKLRSALVGNALAASGHNALTARLVEESGFDVVWASGLEIAASHGVPDANILTMTDVLRTASNMAAAVDVPVLADCDSGFGDIGNVVAMVQAFERAGVAGACIEDKTFPKTNSFAGGPQVLVPIENMVAKLCAAKAAQRIPDFVVVARTEALIAGLNMDEALRRAEAYERAGADALLIHSKKSTAVEIVEFCQRYRGRIPLIAVPTSYPDTSAAHLHQQGIALVIFANQTLRCAVLAIRATLAKMRAAGSAHVVEEDVCSLGDLFALQGVDALLEAQEHYYEKARDIVSFSGNQSVEGATP